MIRCAIKEGSRIGRFYFAKQLDPSPRGRRPDIFILPSAVAGGGELEVGDQVDVEYAVEPDGRLRAVLVERVSALAERVGERTP